MTPCPPGIDLALAGIIAIAVLAGISLIANLIIMMRKFKTHRLRFEQRPMDVTASGSAPPGAASTTSVLMFAVSMAVLTAVVVWHILAS